MKEVEMRNLIPGKFKMLYLILPMMLSIILILISMTNHGPIQIHLAL
jgi:hypothetical protein